MNESDVCTKIPPSTGRELAEILPAPARNDLVDIDESLDSRSTSTCTFDHHNKLQLPPAPNGMEWMYQESTHRWVLRPLLEAEITVLGPATELTPPALLEHSIQPSDTLVGLCLKYGVTTTQIRRANFGFSGNNLSLAPNPLRIPNIQRAVPETQNRDKLLKSFLLVFRDELTKTEAKCYLMLNDWDLNRAIENAQKDLHELQCSTDPQGERARFDTPMEHVIIDEDI